MGGFGHPSSIMVGTMERRKPDAKYAGVHTYECQNPRCAIVYQDYRATKRNACPRCLSWGVKMIRLGSKPVQYRLQRGERPVVDITLTLTDADIDALRALRQHGSLERAEICSVTGRKHAELKFRLRRMVRLGFINTDLGKMNCKGEFSIREVAKYSINEHNQYVHEFLEASCQS